MKLRRLCSAALAAACCLALLSGCGGQVSVPEADLFLIQTDLSALTLPAEVRVVGLGEASHGAAEYHQAKAEVFRALVEDSGCRVFLIEGDFGGALKVDEYIHGGDGTSEDAIGALGFAVYRTRELADLLDWMRDYNETAAPGEDLRFFGADIQYFGGSRDYLLSVLDRAAPGLAETYRAAFAPLTDESAASLDGTALRQGMAVAQALTEELDARREEFTAAVGEEAFLLARECARSIYACCDVRSSDDYNAVRDGYMAEKVLWFLEWWEDGPLFLNGHNGHIGKTSVAGYRCLGERLDEALGESYFAIGTDAADTRFHSRTADGGFEVVEVHNTNDLTGQFQYFDGDRFYLDFAAASADGAWAEALGREQTFTTLNAGLARPLTLFRAAYTTTVVPAETYDAMLLYRAVTPTTLLE